MHLALCEIQNLASGHLEAWHGVVVGLVQGPAVQAHVTTHVPHVVVSIHLLPQVGWVSVE